MLGFPQKGYQCPEWHRVSSALTQQRVLFAWPCCLPLIKVCKQLTDMCVQLHAWMANVKGGLRFPYGSLGKALFDQHAWLPQIVQSENHKQWLFLMLPSACMAVHLEMKHLSLNRVPLITLSQQLSPLCQQFLSGKCVHTKTMRFSGNRGFISTGGFIWLCHCRWTKSLDFHTDLESQNH